MAHHIKRFTLRVNAALLQKLGYIADYEGRTKNKELEHLIKDRVQQFEEECGMIVLPEEKKEG